MFNVLTLGDGDFSFSKNLLKNGSTYLNLIATCFDDEDIIYKKFCNSKFNIDYIKNNGGSVYMNIDASKLEYSDFGYNFDVIIFNFPHSGGKSNIKQNRLLLSQFFSSVVKSGILKSTGIICVSLCKGQGGTLVDLKDRDFNNSWKIEENAAQSNFILENILMFNNELFEDYQSTGYRSQDKCFIQNDSKTYVFRKGKCDVIIKDSLIGQVNFNNEEFFTNSWIASIFNTNINLLQLFLEQFIREFKDYEKLEWDYIIESNVYIPAYKLLQKDTINKNKKEDIEKILINFQLENYSQFYLSYSIYEQIKLHISKINWTIESNYYTSGFCFYLASETNPNCRICDYFFITYEVLEEKSDIFHSIEHELNTSDCQVIYSNNTVKLIDNYYYYEIEYLTIVVSNFIVKIEIFNLTNIIEKVYDIKLSYQLVDLNDYLNTNRFYEFIFNNNLTETNVNQMEFDELLNRIKICQSWGDLEHSCDMSMWCNDLCVDVVRNCVEEIVRCVFKDHLSDSNKIVELIECFYKDGTRLSICLRMKLKSGMVCGLDRGRVNKLQSLVRITTQNLLLVELR